MRNILFIVLLLVPIWVAAEKNASSEKHRNDTVEVTLESTISGNREQPKVLYIVPWQSPAGPEIFDSGFQRAFEGLFKPVERESFLRELTIRAQQTPQTILNTGAKNDSDVE